MAIALNPSTVLSTFNLGSLQQSEDNSRPEMKRRISLAVAASVMSSLSRIWRDKVLQLSTNIRMYQALVMSVLLYDAQTWKFVLRKKTLEAFHMKCRRQILRIRWSQPVTNVEVAAQTGLPPVMDFIRRRRLSEGLFGHIALLTQETPAHNAPHCQVGLASWSFIWWWLETSSWSSSRSLNSPLRNDTGRRPFIHPLD